MVGQSSISAPSSITSREQLQRRLLCNVAFHNQFVHYDITYTNIIVLMALHYKGYFAIFVVYE